MTDGEVLAQKMKSNSAVAWPAKGHRGTFDARGEEQADTHAKHRQMLASPEFRGLVTRRWNVCLALTALLFVLYYGYILLIAFDRSFLSRRIGEATTMAIPVGIGVILGAWALTAVYVVWANRKFDREVARLRDRLKSE